MHYEKTCTNLQKGSKIIDQFAYLLVLDVLYQLLFLYFILRNKINLNISKISINI